MSDLVIKGGAERGGRRCCRRLSALSRFDVNAYGGASAIAGRNSDSHQPCARNSVDQNAGCGWHQWWLATDLYEEQFQQQYN